MAKKIVREIVIDAQTKEAIKNMDKLGKTFEEVFEGANKGIKPLTTQIGELEDAMYALAAAGQTNSQEFKDLQQKVGNYKKVIIDTDLQIDAMAGTTAQNLGGAIEGVSGAFAIGTGAMGAFGVESEAVNDALLRVQSAMAITQGINSVREGMKAFKGLKAAIMASTVVQKILNVVMTLNPVGLIVAGIAALIALVVALFNPVSNLMSAWFGTAEATETAAEANERIEKTYNKIAESLERTIKLVKREGDQAIEIAKLKGATNEEIYEMEQKLLAEQIALNINAMNSKKDAIAEAKVEYFKALEEEDFETAKSIRENNDRRRKELKDLQDIDDQFWHSREKNRLEDEKRQQDARRRNFEKYKAMVKKRQDFDRQTEDMEQANKEQTMAVQLETLGIQFDRETAKLDEALKKREITQAQHDERMLALEEQFRLKRNEISKAFEIEALTKDVPDVSQNLTVLNKKAEVEELGKIEKAFRDNSERLHQISEDKKFKATQQGLEAAGQALSGLSGLSQAITDAELAKAGNDERKKEAIRKKAFERDKKIQLATAIVTGIQSVMSAYQSGSAMPVIGIVMGPLMAAIAAATAAMNIKKIKNTKYESASPTTGSVPTAASAVSAPQFNIAGNSPENQLAQTLGQDQQPVKAFVVAGDVTTAQSMERDKVELSGI